MIEMVLNKIWKVITVIVFDIFYYPPMMNIKVGTGAGAASLYGSGSTKIMRLLAAPAPQH
jgi:hypothetical protein